MEKKLFDNRILFNIYGWINIVLILFLLSLLILIFNQVYVLSRFGFVIFVGIHLALVFFIKIHYLCVLIDEQKEKIEFHYNRRFGWKWRQKVQTTVLPRKQFHGYEISKDSLGLSVISFYKRENEEQFELGPFHVGFLSKQQRLVLKEVLG